MAGADKFRYLAVLSVMMMIISMVYGEEEAEAPSPSLVTGSASMEIVPSLATALFVALFACIFHGGPYNCGRNC